MTNNYSTLTNEDIANGKYPTFIGSGANQFKTQAAFDAYIKKCVIRYATHPAFGGLILRDEPSIKYIPLVAEIYKSVQRVFKDLGLKNKRIIVNFNPFYGGSYSYVTGTTEADYYQSYKNYLDLWLTLSGSDEVQMDIYSLYTFGIYRYHLVNLQMAAEVAAKHGAKISVVNSAWQRMKGKDNPDERFHTYQDMNYMANVTMAYGSMNLSYYMYHACNDTAGQIVSDGSSMITRAGKKTVIYDYAREINAKAQILAPVILEFDYVKGGFYNNFSGSGDGMQFYAKLANYSSSYLKKSYTKLTNVKTNDSKYSWIINELYDDAKGNYMYAVMNTIDSLNTTSTYDDKKSITLTFSSGYTRAWVFRDGKFTLQNLSNSKLTLSNMVGGDACYVIPVA